MYNQNMDFRKEIISALKDTLKGLRLADVEPQIEHPLDQTHGDYSTNVAMVVFGKNKELRIENRVLKTPLELAQEIIRIMNSRFSIPNSIDRVEAVAPGFINFWLSKEAFGKELELALKAEDRYGSFEPGSGKTMVLDHSHPNIAKRFGIGHLRSTIIGQALINIYRFLGWNVISENFLGDWGTQFGALLAQITRTRDKQQTTQKYVQSLAVDDLERLYVQFNKEAQENPELWEEARKWFKRLEDGDQEAREVWQTIKDKSLEEFKRIWDLLGTKFDYIHAESFFEDKVKSVIEDADQKGIAVEDQGAVIVRVPGFESPLILQKSDGATTYETRDLAAIKFWKEEFSPDVIAYEVGAEQALHFQQVFSVAEMLGYADRDSLMHIKHGLYLSPGGKKMRTRTGETVRLEDVLNEAVERARKLGDGGYGGRLRHPSLEDLAKAVGIGAVKYFDLSHHPSSDIVFDWERIFQLEGNSAPYIQYTHARCRSVLEKAKWDIGGGKLDKDVGSGKYDVSHQSEASPVSHFSLPTPLNPEELALLRYFYRFGEIVRDSAYNFSPNLLCNFLFELAQKYNAFYNKHRILNTSYKARKQESSIAQSLDSLIANKRSLFRLALTEVTGSILRTGLGLLGIQAPEEM